MNDPITRYSVMPIPACEDRTTYFDAGAVRFGVEYRLLTDAIAATAAADLLTADGNDRGQTTELDDRGVSIHVYGVQDGEEREFLRFDCFVEEPHYHYVSWRARSNEVLQMDSALAGDPVEFALDRLEHRLPSLLERAGAGEIAEQVEPERVTAVLREVRAAAQRLRARDVEHVRSSNRAKHEGKGAG